MYKDIEKQKEANRLSAQKRRDKAKGMTQGMTNSGYDVQGMTQLDMTKPVAFIQPLSTKAPHVMVNDLVSMVTPPPHNFGQPDCQCKHCQQNRHSKNQLNINHGSYKRYDQLAPNGVNRQTLPGDVDYVGVCKLVDGQWVCS